MLHAMFAIGSAAAAAADSGLELAAEQARRLVVPAGTAVLAADASPEGHWTFVNGKGERFTAATKEEMARMPGVLAPEAKEAGGRLILVVTEASVFGSGDALSMLPRDAGLRLSTATGLYPMTAGGAKVRQVQIGPRLRVEVGERAGFDEVLLQLDKSLARGGIRVVTLEPGAPATLGRRLAIDARAKGDLIERIDPVRLVDAIAGLRGQTVVVTGRLEGKFLHFQVPGAADRSLIVADLTSAAADHDVNLIILDAPAGRQPGSRNWLWLKAEVQGAEGLHPDSGLDGLLSTLASEARPLDVRLAGLDDRRTVLVAVPGAPASSGAIGGIGDALSRAASDLAGSVTGRIEPAAIHMHLVSAQRQRELDRRLIRWLPAWATWGYLGLLVAGAIGAPASRWWWARVWPPEAAADYPGTIGLQAARAVRLLIYALVFMPAAAIASLPATLLGSLRRSRQPA
jgi:hypothetical protein